MVELIVLVLAILCIYLIFKYMGLKKGNYVLPRSDRVYSRK